MDRYKHKGLHIDGMESFLHYGHKKRITMHSLMHNWRDSQLLR